MVNRRHVWNLVGVNLLIAGAGLVSTAQIAWVFGATRQTDIWFAASATQASMLSMVQTGQLSEAFLPEYLRIKAERGKEHAQQCFAVVFNWTCLAALALSALAAVLSPWICSFIGAGFTEAQQDSLRWVFLCLVPLVPMQVVAGMQQMLGNAEKNFGRFEVPVLAGAIGSIVTVAILRDSIGLAGLVIAQWVLFAISFSGRVRMLYLSGYRHRWLLRVEGFSAKAVFSQLGVTCVYVVVTQVYLMIFRRALVFLPPGLMSAFSYAETLFQRVSSLFMRPVSTVFFTAISERIGHAVASRREVIQAALSRYLEMYVLLLAAFLPGLHIFISALWQGPRFGEDLIQQTSWALVALLLSLLPQAQFLVSRKLNISHGFLREQYWAMIANQVLMAIVAYPLVRAFGFSGAVTVSLLNVAGFCVASLLATRRRLRELAMVFSAKAILLESLLLAPCLLAGWYLARQTDSFAGSFDSVWAGKILGFARFGLVALVAVALLLALRWLARAARLIERHDHA